MLTDETNPLWREQLHITDARPIESGDGWEVWRVPRTACGKGFRCLDCARISCHPSDVAARYCGWCHKFHDDPSNPQARAGHYAAGGPQPRNDE